MTFTKPLFASLAIMALALPATTAVTLTLTATPAFAKDGKGNGKGNSKGSERRSAGGKSNANKPAKGNSGNGNGRNALNASYEMQTIATDDTGETIDISDMHPSQLGSMNGALHANINAVLAHIRNGNTNGPVGALAGLAVADYNADGAQDVIDEAANYDALASALEAAGYDTLGDYEDAVAAGDIEAIAAVEDAKTALGDTLDSEPPTEQELADAQAALEAQLAAEDGILDAWNKSGQATEDEQNALLQALRDRLEAESDAIAETIGTDELAATSTDPAPEDEELAEVVETLNF